MGWTRSGQAIIPIPPPELDNLRFWMSSDPTHIPLYADEKALIERGTDDDTTQWKRSADQQLAFFYDIDRTLEWIRSNDFKRVRLWHFVV